MDKSTAIQQISDACRSIARELTRIHPVVSELGEKKIQDEFYRALFELAKAVETIKKRLAQLQSKDNAPDL